ncbi:MAG: hypothetical protein IKJ07_08630 [Clostridia bacterium]|nr:hypothetical protein [Clostridia bacterium]
MLIYYCIAIIANIVAAFVFHKSINISVLSIIPLFLIALMIFQAKYFKSEKVENGSGTAYGSDLTSDEENDLLDSGSKFLFATIPWMIPFVIFFPSFVKALSILVYIVGLVVGLLIYRIKHKGKINGRMCSEDQERKDQEKKEELGKWK